jgi:hypothetical protein
VSTDAVGLPPTSLKDKCSSWFGRYSGELSGDQNFFGRPEKVYVIISEDEIYVGISSEGGGSFDASSLTAHCTTKRLRSTLSTGAEGAGKISLSMTRDKGVLLRLWNYKQGIGPNKAGYLPPDRAEIPMRQVTDF